MRELFIYYRLQHRDATAHAAWRTQVLAMQQGLQALHPGLQTRLLCRHDTVDEWQTWMEIYTRPRHLNGVSTAVQADIEHHAEQLMQGVQGPGRHIEVFIPCAS